MSSQQVAAQTHQHVVITAEYNITLVSFMVPDYKTWFEAVPVGQTVRFWFRDFHCGCMKADNEDYTQYVEPALRALARISDYQGVRSWR